MLNNFNSSEDPLIPDWANISLPDTWPDKLNLSKFGDVVQLFKCIKRDRQPVEFPDSLMGQDIIPKYACQEFHNIPNGNYSNSLSKGYIKGFDISMLGTIQSARQRLASCVEGMESVLDVGCGGGKTAAKALEVGVTDVWGLDPSPYLLQHAARQYPNVKFIQGAAESTGFSASRFDGILACFVFHEIPPKYRNLALVELHKILKPGGTIAIAEPSALQIDLPPMTILKRYGLKGLYFKLLAKKVHEPFVSAWHAKDHQVWFEQHGFSLEEDINSCPIRIMVAKKR